MWEEALDWAIDSLKSANYDFHFARESLYSTEPDAQNLSGSRDLQIAFIAIDILYNLENAMAGVEKRTKEANERSKKRKEYPVLNLDEGDDNEI